MRLTITGALELVSIQPLGSTTALLARPKVRSKTSSSPISL
jgi:hypothetical protein